MECLLSFIEFSQFEQVAMLHLDDPSSLNYHFISFPSNIPLSAIIEDTQCADDGDVVVRMKVMAHKLYLKYIREQSEFEINIGSRLRRHSDAILGDLDRLKENQSIKIKDLVELIEASRMEMFKYLEHSYTRFKRRKEWKRVESVLRGHSRTGSMLTVKTKRTESFQIGP